MRTRGLCIEQCNKASEDCGWYSLYSPCRRQGRPRWLRFQVRHRGAGILKQGEFFNENSLVQPFIPWDLKIGEDLLLTIDNSFTDPNVAVFFNTIMIAV